MIGICAPENKGEIYAILCEHLSGSDLITLVVSWVRKDELLDRDLGKILLRSLKKE